MTVEILPSAHEDLVDGFEFYEQKEPGLGSYFVNTLISEIEALNSSGGAHCKYFGYHRLLSHRFPYAVYYTLEADAILVRAVLDCRRDPGWIRDRLRR